MRHSTYGNAYSRQQMKKDPTLSLPQPDEVNFPSGNIRKPPQIQPVPRLDTLDLQRQCEQIPAAVVSGNHQLWFMPPDGIGRAQNSPCLASFHVHFKKVTGAFPSRLSTESALIRRPDAATAEFLPAQEEKFSSVRSSQAARLSSRTLSPGKGPGFRTADKVSGSFRIRFHGTDGGKPTASVAQEFLYRVAVIRTQVHIGFPPIPAAAERKTPPSPGTNGGRQIFYLTGELVGNQIPVDLPRPLVCPKAVGGLRLGQMRNEKSRSNRSSPATGTSGAYSSYC